MGIEEMNKIGNELAHHITGMWETGRQYLIWLKEYKEAGNLSTDPLLRGIQMGLGSSCNCYLFDVVQRSGAIQDEWKRLQAHENEEVTLTQRGDTESGDDFHHFESHYEGRILRVGILKNSLGKLVPSIELQDNKGDSERFETTHTFLGPGSSGLLYKFVLDVRDLQGKRVFPSEEYFQDIEMIKLINLKFSKEIEAIRKYYRGY
jgi:hypothetical protein